MERLQEIMRQGIDQQMLFIHDEDLCANPRLQLERFYSYLGLPYFTGHDFNLVEQITVEDDEVLGVFGDHQIRRKVESQAGQPGAALVGVMMEPEEQKCLARF